MNLKTFIETKENISVLSEANLFFVNGRYSNWELNGKTICVFNNYTSIFLKNVNILINKKLIYFDFFSKAAIIDSTSGSVSMWGKAFGRGYNYFLITEIIHFYIGDMFLKGNDSIIFFNTNLRISSRFFVIDLINKIFRFNGNVESIIINNF